MIKEQIDNLMPDFFPGDLFNDDADDLQEVLLGHDQPEVANSSKTVHTERIVIFPAQRGCGDMKVILMAN
jgi:hypothetical protein